MSPKQRERLMEHLPDGTASVRRRNVQEERFAPPASIQEGFQRQLLHRLAVVSWCGDQYGPGLRHGQRRSATSGVKPPRPTPPRSAPSPPPPPPLPPPSPPPPPPPPPP